MRGIAELEEQGVVGQRSAVEGRRKFRAVIVRECKYVICTVILQPLTVFPGMVSAVCSPKGLVEVGAILSTAFSAAVF